MTELEISWRGLDPAEYAHLDATAAWGAFAGDELVFVVTEGPADSDQLEDELDEVENLNDVEVGGGSHFRRRPGPLHVGCAER